MKIIRFFYKKQIRFGILENDIINEIKFENEFSKIIPIGIKIKHDKTIKLLPPVMPTKIAAVGLNYRDHAAELKMNQPEKPVLFLKPATSVIGHNDYIVLPESSSKVDYEAELGIIIKKQCYRLKPGQVKKYILGYTCANDVTARDLQKLDGQWTRAKSFDTFCPVGVCIETSVDPSNLNIKAVLNGKTVQSSNTSNMIFDCFYLVWYISNIMTLNAGDVIITGTPPGVGQIKSGDKIEIEIENISKLTNKVK
ncbi:fumarylacetoacetate hydrolase family protein [Candidatus Dependentiae bacterium]|nr:fumarylacetoacetate hydrolase family protein [Candidatus Dependentiae bacterium]